MLVIKPLALRARGLITTHLNSCPCIIGRWNTRIHLLFLKYISHDVPNPQTTSVMWEKQKIEIDCQQLLIVIKYKKVGLMFVVIRVWCLLECKMQIMFLLTYPLSSFGQAIPASSPGHRLLSRDHIRHYRDSCHSYWYIHHRIFHSRRLRKQRTICLSPPNLKVSFGITFTLNSVLAFRK